MITLTPRTTPKTVSALRILCTRSVSMACFKFSPCACAIPAALSLGPQCFDGIELRRPRRGINPEEKSDPCGHAQRQNHRPDRRVHREGKQGLNGKDHKPPPHAANQSADGREH